VKKQTIQKIFIDDIASCINIDENIKQKSNPSLTDKFRQSRKQGLYFHHSESKGSEVHPKRFSHSDSAICPRDVQKPEQ
jgi:hypothetical protein